MRKGFKAAGAGIQGTILWIRSKQTPIPRSYWTEYQQTKKVITTQFVQVELQEAVANIQLESCKVLSSKNPQDT
ncbi:hypothetical protein H4Q26_010772 [Puccinia striiformis f. sp. tritici PST-130]|nr:hypothetical protein H4Q26_010772 [Puccinia striiformis f. sp. tritici PST-130]